MDFSGRTAVVTGAAGGIGAAVSRRLLETGARVLLTDLDDARLQTTASELAQIAGPGAVVALAGDATDEAHLQRLRDLAVERFGQVDLVHANAGVGGGSGLGGEDQWDLAIDVNVRAHVRAARVFLPDWLERGEGYFLSTASAAGIASQIGSATYSVTKHAAVAFAEWLSITYGDQGVRVSCLCPMGVETDLLRTGETSSDPLAQVTTRAVRGAGRVLSPLECADVVMDGLAAEQFLILPHPEVLEFLRFKGAAYDKWLRGMRTYQRTLLAGGAAPTGDADGATTTTSTTTKE